MRTSENEWVAIVWCNKDIDSVWPFNERQFAVNRMALLRHQGFTKACVELRKLGTITDWESCKT